MSEGIARAKQDDELSARTLQMIGSSECSSAKASKASRHSSLANRRHRAMPEPSEAPSVLRTKSAVSTCNALSCYIGTRCAVLQHDCTTS